MGAECRRAHVRVPATTANLGPGFDSFALALTMFYDLEIVEDAPGVLTFDLTGLGADQVPRDDQHLVVRAMRHVFTACGVDMPGLRLRAHNEIPFGRGFGSSASAIVAGLRAAVSLLADRHDISGDQVLHWACEMEGHADNVAACLLGGFVVSWRSARWGAVSLQPHPELVVVAAIPAAELSTERARSVLPDVVPHADAARNAAAAGLLVHAVTTSPEHALDATRDALHQEQRRVAMPETLAVVDALRARGLAAVVSGAGPSVVVLGHAQCVALHDDVRAVVPSSWAVQMVGICPPNVKNRDISAITSGN